MPRRCRTGYSQCFERLATCTRNGRSNMRQIRRLIPPRYRLRMQVTRQQIGAVRLQQEPLRGNFLHERHEMRTTPLVANPARNADCQAHLEVGHEIIARSGEAVGDPTCELREMLPQD